MTCLTINGKRFTRLIIKGSLVCDVNIGGKKYLRVKPDDSYRWVSDEYEITYDVESNTSWRVE